MRSGTLWAVAMTTLLAGSNGKPTFTVFSSPLSGAVPLTNNQSAGVVLPAKYNGDYHWILKLRMGKNLESAVESIQTPPSRRDRRFGLSRVLPTRIGPHFSSEYYDLVSFGNGTSRFDPKNLRVSSASFEGAIRVTDSPSDWKRHAEMIAPLFLAGADGPLRWQGESRVFEARPVRFREASCLKCHTESRIGDVAAILMCSISNERAADMAKREDGRQERLKHYGEYNRLLKGENSS